MAGSTSSERSITQQLVSAPAGAQQTPHAGHHLLPRAVKMVLTNTRARTPVRTERSRTLTTPPPLQSSLRLLGKQIRLSKNAAAELDLTGVKNLVHSGFLGSDSAFGMPPKPSRHVQEEDGATSRRVTLPPPQSTHRSESLTHYVLLRTHTVTVAPTLRHNMDGRWRVRPESDTLSGDLAGKTGLNDI